MFYARLTATTAMATGIQQLQAYYGYGYGHATAIHRHKRIHYRHGGTTHSSSARQWVISLQFFLER